MVKEFKAFVMRGNVLDLAVGVIIGGAFGKIIGSMVGDLLMPVLGLLLGGVDFANQFVTLGAGTFKTIAEAKAAGVATLNYGVFLNTVIEFLLLAFGVFVIVKLANAARKPEPATAPTTKDCPYCTSAIAIAATRCPHCTSQL